MNFKKYLADKGFTITNIEPEPNDEADINIDIELWLNNTIFCINFPVEDDDCKGYVSLSDFLRCLDLVRTLGDDELAKSAQEIVEDLIDSIEEDFASELDRAFFEMFQ